MSATLITRVLSGYDVNGEEAQIPVAWFLTARHNGIVIIDVSREGVANPKDRRIVAELLAIRFLLLDKCSPMPHSFSESNLSLNVSHGAIRKVFRKQSSLPATFQYATYLRIRYSGVVITADKSMKPWDAAEVPLSEAMPLYVPVTEELRAPFIESSIEGIGRVAITEHAIQQFSERTRMSPDEQPKAPFKAILRQLSHPEMTLYRLPESILRNKERKYGTIENLETWRHPQGKYMFVLVTERDTDLKTLVTVSSVSGDSMQSHIRVRARV